MMTTRISHKGNRNMAVFFMTLAGSYHEPGGIRKVRVYREDFWFKRDDIYDLRMGRREGKEQDQFLFSSMKVIR